ncbi:MAG: hypothetical protein ACU85V_05300 [Gammaproteobacteria bacterium]
MSVNRRTFLGAGSALLLTGMIGPRSVTAAAPTAVAALDKSPLIYLSPLTSKGSHSSCQAEVWFVHHESEVFVVTQAKAWRAEAVRRGLTRAGVWIGDFGVWKSADGRYKSAPYLKVDGRLEADAAVHQTLLPEFGQKYADEWGSWGPRFRDGLADGSRVMLRYRIED